MCLHPCRGLGLSRLPICSLCHSTTYPLALRHTLPFLLLRICPLSPDAPRRATIPERGRQAGTQRGLHARCSPAGTVEGVTRDGSWDRFACTCRARAIYRCARTARLVTSASIGQWAGRTTCLPRIRCACYDHGAHSSHGRPLRLLLDGPDERAACNTVRCPFCAGCT